MRILLTTLLAAAGAAALAGALPAEAATATGQQCFRMNDWDGWKAVDEKTIIARVRLNELYRIGFAQSCPRVTFPGVHLVTSVTGGSNLVCKPIDLDVKVGDTGSGGFSTPCIVDSIRKLTPEEVKALPKKDTP